MNQIIQKKLEKLEKTIRNDRYKKDALDVIEWGGADVIISDVVNDEIKNWLDEQPIVISYQNTVPIKRVVITKYSKELSWLFYQLRDIFNEKIDYSSKYDFFGLLAQSAIDYLDINKDNADCESLLLTIIETSKRFDIYAP
jgi:hypothetical protein